MTSVIGILSERFVYIGTDTLTRTGYQIGDTKQRPLLFGTKTFQLPQFKSAFAVTGVQALGIAFYLFLGEKCIGRDVNSIYGLNLQIFKDYLIDKFGEEVYGSIYLYGLDNDTNTFKGYWFSTNQLGGLISWKPLGSAEDNIHLIRPEISETTWLEAEDKANNDDTGNKLTKLIVEIMKAQKGEDEVKPLPEQVGIGGEVVVTTMGFSNDGFSINSLVAYTFPDYQVHFLEMMRGPHAIPNTKI